MTYVTDQTSAELCAHMRKLKAMPGWHEPLADRLWKEVQDLISERDALRAALQDKAGEGPHHWIVPDFGFMFPSEDAAKRYLENIGSNERPTACYTQPAPVVPDGFALVPVEPTDAMVQAAFRLDLSYMPGQEGADRAAVYRAMITASQQKGGQ